MFQAWSWWETNGDFGSRRRDRQHNAGISPSVGRRLWESMTVPGPWQGGGVWALPWLLQRMPHSSVLSLMEACREARVISTTPVSNSLGTYSGVQVPGNRQPDWWGHSRASLGMFHCAPWAQTVEKELWESQWDARKIKVPSRVGVLRRGWSVAQGFRRKNGRTRAPGGKQGGWSGWMAKPGLVRVSQISSSSHLCGQSGWETAALWHPDLSRPLPVPLRPAKAPWVPHWGADLSLTAR